MPIEADAFQEAVARRRHLSHQSPDQRRNEKEYSDKNVHPMEPGKHEETRSHNSRRIEPKSFGKQMAPFVRLVGQKERPKHNRQQQEGFSTARLPDQSGFTEMQSNAAAQQ